METFFVTFILENQLDGSFIIVSQFNICLLVFDQDGIVQLTCLLGAALCAISVELAQPVSGRQECEEISPFACCALYT